MAIAVIAVTLHIHLTHAQVRAQVTLGLTLVVVTKVVVMIECSSQVAALTLAVYQPLQLSTQPLP